MRSGVWHQAANFRRLFSEIKQAFTDKLWERWDSYSADHGFEGQGGDQNASMNSFSHYSFGAVMEWGFRDLVGIDTRDAGFGHIVFRPGLRSANSNPDVKPIDWAKAQYDSVRGPIASHWRRDADTFELNVTVPANTSATVHMPAVLRNRSPRAVSL